MLLTSRPPIADSTFCQSGSDGLTVASTVAAYRFPCTQQASYSPCPVIHEFSAADDANVAISTTVPSPSAHDASCATVGPGGDVSGDAVQPGIFAITADACGGPEEQPASIVRVAAAIACRRNLRMIMPSGRLGQPEGLPGNLRQRRSRSPRVSDAISVTVLATHLWQRIRYSDDPIRSSIKLLSLLTDARPT